MANLIGKNILIVDEVDDTRTTLEYAVRELQKDVETAKKHLGREDETTRFFVFVLHVSATLSFHLVLLACGLMRWVRRTRTSPRKASCRSRWSSRVNTTPR